MSFHWTIVTIVKENLIYKESHSVVLDQSFDFNLTIYLN